MKNDSSVAVTRLMPRIRPAEIVAPERDTPGISEKHCTRPMTRPSLTVISCSPRWMPRFSSTSCRCSAHPDDGAPQDERERHHPQAAQGALDEVADAGSRRCRPGSSRR